MPDSLNGSNKLLLVISLKVIVTWKCHFCLVNGSGHVAEDVLAVEGMLLLFIIPSFH
jgi:hypothetical protein